MRSEFLLIATRLFEAERRPMTPRELIDLAYRQGLFSDKRAGKTPHQTMKSKLSVHVRKHGQNSPFVRTEPGKFYLRRLLDSGAETYEARPIQPVPADEQVLVFPTSALSESARFQGITTHWRPLARRLLNIRTCTYLDRQVAESGDGYKQVLTYVIVTRNGRVLAYKRGTYSRVADFLRGSQCIGFGGHVILSDRTLFNERDLGLVDSAARELVEELRLPNEDVRRIRNGVGLRTIGAINDDSSDVGIRHFAFVLRYEVSDSREWDTPVRGEKAITQLHWLYPGAPNFELRTFEYWSQLCLRKFFAAEVGAQPTFLLRRKKPLRPPHVLCVVGPIGSGKSETTDVLKRDFGYTEINSGAVLADLLGLPPVPLTARTAFQRAAWDFIKAPDGPVRLAAAIRERVRGSAEPRILVDGVRQLETLHALKHLAQTDTVGLLYVHTPIDLAYRFLRRRTEQAIRLSDFLQIRSAPVEREVEEMIAEADAVLYNWTGRPAYRRTIPLHEEYLRVCLHGVLLLDAMVGQARGALLKRPV